MLTLEKVEILRTMKEWRWNKACGGERDSDSNGDVALALVLVIHRCREGASGYTTTNIDSLSFIELRICYNLNKFIGVSAGFLRCTPKKSLRKCTQYPQIISIPDTCYLMPNAKIYEGVALYLSYMFLFHYK